MDPKANLYVIRSIEVEKAILRQYFSTILFLVQLKGLPGEKGQKGDLGQPAIDVFQAVKVLFLIYTIYVLCMHKIIYAFL